MEFYRFFESGLEHKSEVCYLLLALFNSFGIRLNDKLFLGMKLQRLLLVQPHLDGLKIN